MTCSTRRIYHDNKKGLERLPTNQRATKGLPLSSKDGGDSFIGQAWNRGSLVSIAAGAERHFLLPKSCAGA